MAINDTVQYTSGFLPYILLFTQALFSYGSMVCTIIDISTIFLQCTINATVVMLGYNWLLLLCCFLTLTDPLRIQPWSQDRRNQTKSNRESEMSMESRRKRTDKK